MEGGAVRPGDGGARLREVPAPPLPAAPSVSPLTLRDELNLAENVSRDPSFVVDALAPIIGRTLRRSVGRFLRRQLLRLNHILLYTVSLRGWRWRVEARRRGVSFAQVVYEQSLVCDVQEVLLIHKETGLLLAQARREKGAMRDGDMVSGMLTAVQDFVQDSFDVKRGDRLQTIQVGDLTVWIDEGPLAVLAGILHGYPTPELRTTFQGALARIHARLGEALRAFAGDTRPFEAAQPVLASCLNVRVRNPRESLLTSTWLVLVATPLLGLAALWLVAHDQHRWRQYLARLENEPGFIVLQAGRSGLDYQVRGLRDPLAANPVALLQACGLNTNRVASQWLPYQALTPDFIRRRARAILTPPESVLVELKDDVLVLRGRAPRDWIATAPLVARGLAGVAHVDVTDLVDVDNEQMLRWQTCLEELTRQPGLVIIESGRRDGRFYLVGLRDPLAREPWELIKEAGFRTNDVVVSWKPHYAVHDSFMLARATRVLRPPPTVRLSVTGAVLWVSGRASHAWAGEAHVIARNIPGLEQARLDGLVDTDREEFDTLRAGLESRFFRFLAGAPDLWPGEQARVVALVADLKQLRARAARLGETFAVEVRGHTLGTGKDKDDLAVSEAFAERFVETFRAAGGDVREMTVRGLGGAVPTVSGYKDEDRLHNRCVTLKIVPLAE